MAENSFFPDEEVHDYLLELHGKAVDTILQNFDEEKFRKVEFKTLKTNDVIAHSSGGKFFVGQVLDTDGLSKAQVWYLEYVDAKQKNAPFSDSFSPTGQDVCIMLNTPFASLFRSWGKSVSECRILAQAEFIEGRDFHGVEAYKAEVLTETALLLSKKFPLSSISKEFSQLSPMGKGILSESFKIVSLSVKESWNQDHPEQKKNKLVARSNNYIAVFTLLKCIHKAINTVEQVVSPESKSPTPIVVPDLGQDSFADLFKMVHMLNNKVEKLEAENISLKAKVKIFENQSKLIAQKQAQAVKKIPSLATIGSDGKLSLVKIDTPKDGNCLVHCLAAAEKAMKIPNWCPSAKSWGSPSQTRLDIVRFGLDRFLSNPQAYEDMFHPSVQNESKTGTVYPSHAEWAQALAKDSSWMGYEEACLWSEKTGIVVVLIQSDGSMLKSSENASAPCVYVKYDRGKDGAGKAWAHYSLLAFRGKKSKQVVSLLSDVGANAPLKAFIQKLKPVSALFTGVVHGAEKEAKLEEIMKLLKPSSQAVTVEPHTPPVAERPSSLEKTLKEINLTLKVFKNSLSSPHTPNQNEESWTTVTRKKKKKSKQVQFDSSLKDTFVVFTQNPTTIAEKVKKICPNMAPRTAGWGKYKRLILSSPSQSMHNRNLKRFKKLQSAFPKNRVEVAFEKNRQGSVKTQRNNRNDPESKN